MFWENFAFSYPPEPRYLTNNPIPFSVLSVSAVILVLGVIRTLGPSSSRRELRQENVRFSRSNISDRKSRQTTSWDRTFLNTIHGEILNSQILWLRMWDFSRKIKAVTSTFLTQFLDVWASHISLNSFVCLSYLPTYLLSVCPNFCQNFHFHFNVLKQQASSNGVLISSCY